jgi:hypothetical protein
MARLVRVLGLVAATASALGAQGRSCGVERWPVKVAVDASVARVDTMPVATTISALRAFPRPPRPMPYNTRVAPHELQTFRVRAILRQVIPESDSDWHLVLEDPDRPGATLVAEVPDANCAIGSIFAERYTTVRRDLRGAPRNATIEIVGIGFFDYLHGQRGMAPNGFELHPVLSVIVIGRAPATKADSTPRGADSVWVNTGSQVYHCRGTRYYGATKAGYYATETKARANGARPAYGRPCS